jgi:hypothetical protein
MEGFMQGRVGAVALMVGLASLPLQASPASADVCTVVGGSGSLLVNDGALNARSWLINVDGITYQSDQFDKFAKVSRSIKVKSGNKSKKVKEVVFTFKDKRGITRTAGDGVKSVNVAIKGEVNEHLDSAFVTIKDNAAGREYRIDDPAAGAQINCG